MAMESGHGGDTCCRLEHAANGMVVGVGSTDEAKWCAARRSATHHGSLLDDGAPQRAGGAIQLICVHTGSAWRGKCLLGSRVNSPSERNDSAVCGEVPRRSVSRVGFD